MPEPQAGILEPHAPVARSLAFRIAPEADCAAALRRLRDRHPPAAGVVGVGLPAVLALGKSIPGLRVFPALAGPGCSVPSTQQALWFLLRGPDRGTLFDASRDLRALLADSFIAEDAMDLFKYRGGRDLTRFEDGTENPKGEAAAAAAIATDGSSFAAVQRWVHDLDRFHRMTPRERNDVIGRDAETNEELEDAPETAHVKRTAQESFDPAAFMVRRSMPWAGETRQGLEFIAYVASLDAFDRMMRRMVGEEDGLVDGLFRFSHPITGGYYWLPPVRDGRIDLSALGL
ncbi:MAG: Dyp-type peroxidase [Myxococcales bacterium]